MKKETWVTDIVTIGNSRYVLVPAFIFKNGIFDEGEKVRVTVSDDITQEATE